MYQADSETGADGQIVASSGGEPGAIQEERPGGRLQTRPMEPVWLDTINDVTWWRYELEEPALLHIS